MHAVESTTEVNPQMTGGNYVDVSLHVVVMCATDTIMVSILAYNPSHNFSHFIIDYVS